MKIPKRLLAIICCPICHADLDYNQKGNKLRCGKCKKSFEVKEGVPILIP